MTEAAVISCSQENCPVLTDGRCLEGFTPIDCPHASLDAPSDGNESDRPNIQEVPGEQVDDEDTEDTEGEEEGRDPEVELDGDDSMNPDQANGLAAQFGAFVVLVVGEQASGKTSLIAGLYAQFLDGPVDQLCFNGSNSLCALDRRYNILRHGSQFGSRNMPRTEDEDMRLLDLRVASPGGSVRNLMLTDIRGEFFENVIDGAPIEEEISLAPRADLVLVLVDGEKLNDSKLRFETIHNHRQLMLGLAASGGVVSGTRLVVVVSKADILSSEADIFVKDHSVDFVSAATDSGFSEVELQHVAAIPKDPMREPSGLAKLLDLLVKTEAKAPQAPRREVSRPERSFLRLGYS